MDCVKSENQPDNVQLTGKVTALPASMEKWRKAARSSVNVLLPPNGQLYPHSQIKVKGLILTDHLE